MKNWLKSLRDFFFHPSSGRSLAVIRIVIGIAMLSEALRVFPSLDALYGPYGYLQADLIEAITGLAVPGLLARAGVTPEFYETLMRVFFLSHIAVLVFFTVGFQSRLASIGVWLTQTVLINSGFMSSYGVDRYFQNICFMMIFFPIAEQWAIDSWIRLRNQRSSTSPQVRVRPSCTLGLRLIQIFLLMTYVNAGLSKAAGHDWWTGEAIWKVLNQPEFHQFNFYWMANYPWLAKALALSTLFIECFYIVGVWFPRLGSIKISSNRIRNPYLQIIFGDNLRTPGLGEFWILAVVGLHLGIALTMGLTLFGCSLAALNLAIFGSQFN